VTARMNHPYVKTFIEERDLRVIFVFDYSGSGEFGNTLAKRQKAIELTASLMFSAMQNNDSVGLAIFTDRIERYIPPRKGRRHVLTALSTILSHQPASRKTDIRLSLEQLSKVLRRRSTIFILSDFHSKEFMQPLKILRKRHDVIAISINDARELSIPDVGLIELEDEETGEQLLVDTSDSAFRERYHLLLKSDQEKRDRAFHAQKVDTVSILTDEPYDMPMRRFFRQRMRRAVR